MNQELLTKQKCRKETSGRRKQGQEYRDTLPACRDENKKAKTQLELNLAKDVRDKKGFSKYPGDKRKRREPCGPGAE